MRTRAGMSLVELVVALTVLAIGVLGLVGAAAVAHRAFTSADGLERATRAASVVIDSLMREPEPSAGERIVDGLTVAWAAHPMDPSRPALVRIDVDVTPDVALDGSGARQSMTWQVVHNARLLR